MTAEHWQKVEAIVQAALDIESNAERSLFVSQACAGNDELRSEIERLIVAADHAESFIESSAWTASRKLDSVEEKNFLNLSDERFDASDDLFAKKNDFTGGKIDVYELKRELGRGGMGAVFLAERADGEFEQKVAIKLIKRGMDTDFIVKRFRHERQILAALEHPNVARLIGGGTTTDGSPYFVMEFVEGEPLYQFCDQRQFSVKERLRLFVEICAAVEAAHKIRVVHRDLKPSNILVKADSSPKLLDFGIAKILDPELASATLEPTATAMRLMTPEYASPEQVCGEPVTPASDIYSLGVLLYELLTGHRPYRFKNRALHEIHRAVCEEIPSVPSESLTCEDNLVPTAEKREKTADERVSLENICRARNTDCANLRRELAGDLDKIILKALRKNPAERYQTADALTADINSYLEKRPVSAELFAPENRKIETTVSPANSNAKESVAILPFKMFGAKGGAKETDSGEFLGIGLADALVMRLSGVPRLVVRPTSSVLGFDETVDPFDAGKKLAVRFVVDGSIRRSGRRIRVSAQLLNVETRATVWAQTFDEQFTDVLTLEDSISERVAESLLPKLSGEENDRLQKRGTNSPEAHEAYLRGRFYWNQFTPEALPKALQSFQKAVQFDSNYALAYVGVADFYAWANIYGLIASAPALDEAERAARRAIEIDPRLGEAYASLGAILHNRKRWAESEKVKRQAIKLSPNYVHSHEWWAAQLVGLGKFAEGIEEIRIAERLDPLSLRTKTLVAWTFYQAHQYDEALARASEIIELDKNYPQGYSQLGNNLLALGQTEKALAAFRQFDQMIPDFPLTKFSLCFGLVAANRHDEAAQVLDELKTLAARAYVKPFFLAMAHAALDRRDEAFAFFEKSFEEDEPWLLWLGTEPMLERLRDDERLVRLLERMNNPIAEQFKNR